jgi:hypothetical protein
MNIFDHFKISQNVYVENFLFESFYRSTKKSTIEDINSTLEMLIPKPCGHELIRVGGENDGGYLVPDDLDGIEALFSPGVNNFKDFEDYLAHNFKIKSFMCDYTSDVKKLRTPIINGLQFFEKKWLDTHGGKDCVSLNDWVKVNTTPNSDLMLQMDIEGAEYRNLLHTQESILKRFRIIVIELHGFRYLWKDNFLNGILRETLKNIDRNFVCAHAHPNNCCGVSVYGDWTVPNVMEFTFLRKDRVRHNNVKVTLPNFKDHLNVTKKAPLHLEGEWLRHAEPTDSRYNSKLEDIDWLEAQLVEKNNQLKAKDDSLTTIYRSIRCSIDMLRNNCSNISINKQFSQSSVSGQYLVDNSNSIISGRLSGKFGFHTNLEEDPWCIINLQRIEPVLAIVISNRLDAGSLRAKTLRVHVSENGQHWTMIYDHSESSPFGGLEDLNSAPALLLNLYGLKLQFVKLELTEKSYFHLDQVEIFKSLLS